MEFDVSIDGESLEIDIENPYRVDVAGITAEVLEHGKKHEIDLAPFNFDQLIPRMIRGVAGCEGGCPTDAMSMVREGFGKFKVTYVEGGILTATQTLDSGKPLVVKLFPDFD